MPKSIRCWVVSFVLFLSIALFGNSGAHAAAVWTDSTLNPGSTTIKAAHIIEIKNLIDVKYAGCSLPLYAWTTEMQTLAPGSPVRADHINELRNAIRIGYALAGAPGLPNSVWGPNVYPTEAVRASFIIDLRTAIDVPGCSGLPIVCPGNGCQSGENCVNCPADCGVCPFTCPGNGCESAAGENCSNCPADCATGCGDGCVTGAETCEPPNTAVCDASCQAIGCACTGWTDNACNAGGCTSQMQQTRSCAPGGCLSESRCVANASCQTGCVCNVDCAGRCGDVSGTDSCGNPCTASCGMSFCGPADFCKAGGYCTNCNTECSNWSAPQACGDGGCPYDQRLKTRDCGSYAGTCSEDSCTPPQNCCRDGSC